MDYYNYVNQLQSVDGRRLSAAEFTDGHPSVDVASLRFSLSGGGGVRGGGARYPGGLLGHCGTSAFIDGQQREVDRSAVANGELSPSGRRNSTYERPLTTSTSATSASTPSQTATVNDYRPETTNSTSRYLPPPLGTDVLPPLSDNDDDDDDDVAAQHNDDVDTASPGDEGSSAASSQSSTSDPAAAACTAAAETERTGRKDPAVTTKKTSTTRSAAAAELTSSQPLIYPWMRRVHSSSSNGQCDTFIN